MAGAAEIKNATAGIRGARPETARRTCVAHMSKLGIRCHLSMVQDCQWKGKTKTRIGLFCASWENLKASLPQHGRGTWERACAWRSMRGAQGSGLRRARKLMAATYG